MCHLVNFAMSVDQRVKMKVVEKMDKYMDLAKELKKLWNMNVILIQILVSGWKKRRG